MTVSAMAVRTVLLNLSASFCIDFADSREEGGSGVRGEDRGRLEVGDRTRPGRGEEGKGKGQGKEQGRRQGKGRDVSGTLRDMWEYLTLQID